MSRVRQPENKDASVPQPHEPSRETRQPYNKEQEDYYGASAIKPPEENVDKRDNQKARRKS